MSTIQLRRDSAADWTAANPILSAGEKGVELDTGKEKTGDGTTAWNDLDYFGGSGGGSVDTVTATNGTIIVAGTPTDPTIAVGTGIPESAITNLTSDLSAKATTAALAAHEADTTAIHGIADTSVLATASSVASAISTHEADTTSVHGIADTSVLATATDVSGAITTHTGLPDPHAGYRLESANIPQAEVTNLTSDLSTLTTNISTNTSNIATNTSAISSNTTAIATKSTVLTRTAVKTANYTAALWDLVPCDTSGGAFTLTFPAASGGKGRIVIKLVNAGNTLNLALTGADKFNTSTGATTGTLTLANQAIVVESDGSGIWTVTADDIPLSQLDIRYAPIASPTFTGTPTAPTASGGTNTTQIATTAFVQTASGLLIPKSLGSGQGSLIGFSAVATPVDIPVGTNRQVLAADSTQTPGVKWRNPGGMVRPTANILGTRTFHVPGVVTTNVGHSTTVFAINTVVYAVLAIGRAITVTEVAARVVTAPASAAHIRLGLYAATSACLPTGAALWDAEVNVGSGATGQFSSVLGAAVTLEPGLYLSAVNIDVAMSLGTLAGYEHEGWGDLTQSATSWVGSKATQTYGAFPGTPTAPTAWPVSVSPYAQFMRYTHAA